MKLNFGQEVLNLPASVLSCCSDADAAALRVLLFLASDLSLAQKPKQLAKLADCDQRSLKAILQFWKLYGVICEEAQVAVPVMTEVHEAPAPVAPKAKKVLLRRADELPQYSSVELAELMESRAAVRILIDEAQQILGKMFNPSEVNILVGMLDYLGMKEESILLLLAHCKKIGKTNLRAIEKYAYTLVDREITEPEALEAEFLRAEALHTFEGEIRTLFGMRQRALTTKESKMLSAWLSFGYGIDIVRLAYEITVNATNEPSVAYANAILEHWNASEWRTLEEIQRGLESEKAKKAGKSGAGATFGNSFDTDDFFEAALRRSFENASES